MGLNIGPHVQRPTPAALSWAARAPIVKQIGGTEALAAAPADAIQVYRWVFGNGIDLTKPATAARAILDGLNGYRHPNLFVEPVNEPAKADRVLLLPFVRDLVQIFHARGLFVCGPSWASGDYEAEDWSEFRAAGWFGLDAISVHAYWSKEVGPTTWNGYRWRRYYDALLDRALPVFVTECGIGRVRDGVSSIDEGMIGADGWKRAGIAPAEYASLLSLYAEALRPREYCLPFTSGADSDWDRFDVDDVSPLLLGVPAEVHDSSSSDPLPEVAPVIPGIPDRPVAPVLAGPGLTRSESLIGPFTEPSTFDDPGTEREVERIATAKGWATWARSTNEVVVYAFDGSMWRDYGNHGTGQLVKVSPGFLA